MEDMQMSSYIIRVKDTEDNSNVKVSFESEGIDIVDEESKAFELCAYILDCVQDIGGEETGPETDGEKPDATVH